MKIIYFAPVEWSSIKQRPQHLAQLLAERHDFYYVQPLGLRKLKLSDGKRILQRIFGIFRPNPNDLGNKVHIKNPIFIPLMMSNKLMQQLNIWLLTLQLKKHIDNNTILWVTSPVNIMPMLLKKLKYKALIYEMMDDYAKIHLDLQNEIARTEELLIAKADMVITTSLLLLEKAENISGDKNCVLIGNGVDYDFFVNNISNRPTELSTTKKIVGYIGAIDKWMDFETVEFLALMRPDIDFVFIGPVKVKNIPQAANLHFIGMRNYETLPQYLQAFAVCLIPFTPGEFADSINPVKLYEYFSYGKPVVLYYMRELREFTDFLYIADSKEDFLLKLDKALNEQNTENVSKRKMVAQQHDWHVKAKILEGLLLQLLQNTGYD